MSGYFGGFVSVGKMIVSVVVRDIVREILNSHTGGIAAKGHAIRH